MSISIGYNGSLLPCGEPVVVKLVLWQAADRAKQVLHAFFVY
jgi:hypothetical protein